MGHTRLSILELSLNGAQPMQDPVTATVLVFNGEIYNHRALRGRLREAGHGWRGSSDTETLLIGYRKWGRQLPAQLKGMFAFALYNPSEQSLFVVRDRFGIKPVYYVWRDRTLSVASEVRALLPVLTQGHTPQSIAAYLRDGACPEQALLWPEVRCLPPAHCLEITAAKGPRLWPYW